MSHNSERFFGNMHKSTKRLVSLASKASGQRVTWRDTPSSAMDNSHDRADYGSMWSQHYDLSKFWKCYRLAEGYSA